MPAGGSSLGKGPRAGPRWLPKSAGAHGPAGEGCGRQALNAGWPTHFVGGSKCHPLRPTFSGLPRPRANLQHRQDRAFAQQAPGPQADQPQAP